jgi:uncharacterized protein (DUF433 family)
MSAAKCGRALAGAAADRLALAGFCTLYQSTYLIIMQKAKGTFMANLLERISINPAVCGGKPCIKGTRIWVSLILDLLASGMTEAELRAEYPHLTHEDILAAIAYGAEASRERMIPLPVEPAE